MRARTLLIMLSMCLFISSSAFCQLKMMPWEFDPRAERALKANTDLLGEKVLASGEPSFEGVAQYFPAMKRPRVVVGVKEHPDFIGVSWDGTLEVGRYWLSFRLGDPPSPYGIKGPVTRSLLGGYLPIVQTQWQFDGLLYEETVLGHSQNLSADEPLWAYVRLRVTNPRHQELGVRITVYSVPARGGPVPSFAARVPVGGHHDFYFKIPHHVDPQHLVFPIDSAEFGRALSETEIFWKAPCASGGWKSSRSIRIPDWTTLDGTISAAKSPSPLDSRAENRHSRGYGGYRKMH